MNIFQPVFNDFVFYLVSIVALIGALNVVLERSIIRAGFSLMICFGAVAAVYFTLQAPFVAASQILIYAVGITLIIVFGLMLTSLQEKTQPLDGEFIKIVISLVISFGIFAIFSRALLGQKWHIIDTLPLCPKNTEIIGLKLFGDYVLPFELISVLLLIALIGAIVIAKKDTKDV